MKSLRVWVALGVMVGCCAAWGAEDSSSKASWTEKMTELSKVISELLPDIASQSRFNDSKNYSNIEKNIEKLSQLSHAVSGSAEMSKSPDMDPSISFLSEIFSSEMKRAQSQFKSGNREYARSVLKSMTGFCITCHTRGQSGPQFESISWANDPVGLTAFERAELFAATRQFDKAIDEYARMISSSDYVTSRQIEWEKAIRHALAIAVRVKDDPAQAEKLVDSVLGLPGGPAYIKQDAKDWKQSIVEWKKELGRKTMTAQGVWAEAERLMARGAKIQKYPTDRAADIYFLRASKRVHDFLRVSKDPQKTSLALYYAGIAYEALGDLRLFSLSDVYFEACIRKSPHTQVARNCYGRYEQSVFVGYSGSGGVAIPEDAKALLGELRDLSDPRPKK